MGGNEKKLTLIVDLVNKTEKKFKEVYSSLEEVEKKTENTRRAMREMGAVGAVALAGLGLATKRFLADAGELEQAEIAFETMLGSASAAKDMLEELSDFASKTPFELQGIRGTAKQLLAMGIESDKIIPTMKALGDVSAGLSVDLDRVAYNYGQVKTQTKLTGTELKDFMRAGIPLLGALADVLGKSENEIKEMASAGEIGFPVVEEAFRRMTSSGGQFEDLMFKQSASLNGQLSNLQDNLTRMSEIVGTALLPAAKAVTTQLVKLTQTISEWVEKNPKLATTILAVVAGLSSMLVIVGLLGLVLPRLALAWAAITAAMTPMTAGIAALVVAAIFLATNWDMVKEKMVAAWNYVVAMFQAGVEKIKGMFNIMLEALSVFWEKWGKTIITVTAFITGLYIPTMARMLAATVTSLASQAIAWVVMAAQATKSAVIIAVKSIPLVIAATIQMAKTAALNAAIYITLWSTMAVKSLIQAAKMAGAWIVAMGPIAWAIAAIAGFVTLVILNWDKLKNVTEAVFNKIGSYFGDFWKKVADMFKNAVTWIIDHTIGPLVDGFKKLLEMVGISGDGIGEELAGLTEDFNVTAGEIDAAAFDVDAAMAGMLGSVGDTADGASDYLTSLADTVGAIRDEIRATYDDMAAATADFQKSIGQETQRHEDDIVGVVAEAYEKKKELERELKDAKRGDDTSKDEINRLQDQIDEQSDIISTYKDMQLALDDEIAERRKYLRMNELEQMQADHERKLQMIQKEYLEDQVKMLQKLLALKQEEQYVLNSISVQTRAAVEAELQKRTSHRETLENQKAGLGSWISETTTMYNNYVRDINKALSNIEGSGNVKVSFTSRGSSGARASGGPVQPGRTFLVGEKGPELFTPGQHGIISPNSRSGGGGVVNVYFTGNTFTGEKYADEIKRKIVRDLQQTMRISVT